MANRNGRRKQRTLYIAMATKCFYCKRTFGAGSLRAEHFIPLCRGGRDDQSNIVAACEECDKMKGPLTGDEFLSFDRKDHHRRKQMIRAVQAELLDRTRRIVSS